MTGPSDSSLSSAKVHRLLAAVGSTYEPERTAGPVEPYDWRDPHCFNEDQRQRLAALAGQVAARMARTFAHFHSGEFSIAPLALTQHFANDLACLAGGEQDYHLTFGPEKGPACGFVVVPVATALAWVGLLLGDAEAGGSAPRALSSLEESLLSDLAGALVGDFLTALRPHHHLKIENPLCQGQPGIQYELTEELCRIALGVKKAGSEKTAEFTVVLPCNRLAALVGKATAAAARVSLPESSRALMEHLQQMPVTVTARLASTSVRFREMQDLGPGDILLLGKPLDEPLELVLDGRPAFGGRPARAEGRYAVVVTPAPAGRIQETPAPKPGNEAKKG
jgi:flagellar motor switch/type III secretory pathway protein FliN